MASRKKRDTKTRNLFVFQPTQRAQPVPFVPGPNAELPKFIAEHSTPYDPKTDKYDVPAFDRDIEVNKAAPPRAILNMHRYWSKKHWAAIRQLIEDARRRFADYPWVVDVLEGMDEIARMQDRERFMKEALYSSRKMNSRLSAKEEPSALTMEALAPSFLRRRKSQGKAQFNKPDGK